MGLLRSLSLFPDKDLQARPWWRSAPPLASGWLLMMRDAMWGARQRVFGETTGPETGRADGGGSAPPENCGGRVGLTESGRRDSNPGPSGPKPDALPDCATPRYAETLIREQYTDARKCRTLVVSERPDLFTEL